MSRTPGIREATPRDGAEIARLLTVLGHPTSAALVAEGDDGARRGALEPLR